MAPQAQLRAIDSLHDPECIDQSLENVRQLILNPYSEKQAELESLFLDLQARLDSREAQTSRCADNLVDAIETLHSKNVSLDQVLDPDVKQVVHRIFKNEPETMAESLYPVLGPAIRKMIASLFEFSATGKAETFKVEQLLLIHRETSTVVAKAFANDVDVQDADVVSGMLEAIRSFIQDAFEVSDFDGVNTLTLGDITVWTIWSPQVVLAVVIRGIPPETLKQYYENLLRELHQQHEQDFLSYEGEIDDSLQLDEKLQWAIRQPDSKSERSYSLPIRTPALILGAVFLTMVLIAKSVGNQRAWTNALAALSAEPGVVVLSADRKFSGGSMALMRDPRASSRAAIVKNARIDTNKVTLSWSPFYSADPELIAAGFFTQY